MPGLLRPKTAPHPHRPAVVEAGGAAPAPSFAEHVREGLGAERKSLGCQYLYDAEGSRLFERICELPEYYPTRTEDAILAASAPRMVTGFDGPPTMVELGSGSSTKTRRLIAAALREYGRLHYVPIDISPAILEEAAADLSARFPTLKLTPVAGDYRSALPEIARRFRGPKLITFLGSSLGNYDPEGATGLLRLMAETAGPGGRLLLGTDLVKDRSILEPAYDDAQGVTARFNLNLLARINRELGASFDLGRFRHRARYNPLAERVELHLVSLAAQEVAIPGAGIVARFAEGEAIHTENSHKYTTRSLADLAGRSGFAEEAAWADPKGWFRVQRWKAG
jgi:dimethylhistidine N-methyltransferase